MNSNFFIQLPAGHELAYNPSLNAAEKPFNPAIAIALTAATLITLLALWLTSTQQH